MRPIRWYKKQNRRVQIVLISLVGLLIALRMALPFIVKKIINEKLADLHGFYGQVEDVDMLLIAGQYSLDDISIYKKDDNFFDEPVAVIGHIDFAINWRALFKGYILGRVHIDSPNLTLITKYESGNGKKNAWDMLYDLQKKTKKDNIETLERVMSDNFSGIEEVDWKTIVDDLMPIRIDEFRVTDGEIRYVNRTNDPVIDLFVNNIAIELSNLTNSLNLSDTKVAGARISGSFLGSAPLNITGRFDPYAETLAMDADGSIEQLDLRKLNNFIESYAKVDMESGILNVYVETGIKNGVITGYLKPIITNPDVYSPDEDKGDFWQRARELLADAATTVVTNIPEDQVASKIYFEGDLNDPNIKTLKMIGYILKNMFIRALKPGVEKEVYLNEL